MARVTAKNLWKTYDDHVVLENVNLDVADREFVTIVGASGCGKTTFLKMLLGMETPSRGQLLIDGQPIVAEPNADRGIVFQRYSLFPHLTVLQNVLLGLEFERSKLLGKLFGTSKRNAIGAARASCWSRSGSRRRATNIRRSCRAACSSACRSRSR